MKKIFCSTVCLISCILCAPIAAAQEQSEAIFQQAVEGLQTSDVQELASVGLFAIGESGEVHINEAVTRAEFVQIVLRYLHPEAESNTRCFDDLDPDLRPGFAYHLLFTDVSVREPYAPALCTAMITGVIGGYPDGSFRPNAPINFAEAAKVINHAFGMYYEMPDYSYQVWYESYVQNFQARNVIPESIQTYDQNITEKEASTTLSALLQSLRDDPLTYPNELPLWGSNQQLSALGIAQK